MNYFAYLNAYPIIEDVHCVDTVQARKHKQKRINKKWLKRYGMKDIPSKQLIVFDGKIIGHPKTIRKMVKAINEKVEI